MYSKQGFGIIVSLTEMQKNLNSAASYLDAGFVMFADNVCLLALQ